MKKALTKKIMLALFSVLLVVCVVALAACKPTVTISFETDGGTAIEAIQAKAGEDISSRLPADPTKDGYVFGGWYTDEARTQKASLPSVMPDADTTYYAKWTQLYTLTLDLNGGTLSTTSLTLFAGDNVYDAVKDLVPTKDGVEFGAWFNGNSELTQNTVMPESDLTLTARYKVAYTINVYIQDVAEQTKYVADESLKISGVDYVGATVVAPTLENYYVTAHEDASASLVLTDKASDNVFNVYYNRESYTVSFNANAPRGVNYSGSVAAVEFVYGAEAVAPQNAFVLDGNYRFAGWSTSPSGEVEIAVGEQLAYRTRTLYAVWDLGYTNRFGGSDVIYVPSNMDGVAILVRGDRQAEGETDGVNFNFSQIGLSGKLGINHTFVYYNESTVATYSFYDGYSDYFNLFAEEGEEIEAIDRTRTIAIDAYFDGVYTYEENGQKVEVNGTIIVDDATGYYVFYVEGDEANTFTFETGATEDNLPVFYVIGDEVGYYDMVMITDVNGDGVVNSGVYILLDGAGGIIFIIFDGMREMGDYGYYAIVDSHELGGGEKAYEIEAVLEDDWGFFGGDIVRIAFSTRPYDEDGGVFYMINGSVYGEYEGKVNGEDATLILDGYGQFEESAVLTVGDKTYSGRFLAKSSNVYGTILEYHLNNGEIWYLSITNGEEAGSFTLLESSVEEYVYCLTIENQGEPVILLYGEEVKDGNTILGQKAVVYDVDADGKLVVVASGYYTLGRIGGLQVFEVTITSADDANRVGTQIVYFSYEVANAGGVVNIFIMYEYFGEKTYTVYTLADGNGEIWDMPSEVEALTGIGSIYFTNNNFHLGTFEVQSYPYFGDNYIGIFTYYVENGRSESIYFEVSGNVVEILEQLPLTLLEADQFDYFSLYDDFGLILDGKGNAIYNEYVMNERYADPYVFIGSVKGTYEITGTSLLGDTIYTFYPVENNDGYEAFEFIIQVATNLAGRNTSRFHKFNEEAPYGEYSAANGAKLVADGFYYHASITYSDGTTINGTYNYYFMEDGSYQFDPESNVPDLLSTNAIFFIITDDGFAMMDQLNPHNYRYLEFSSTLDELSSYYEAYTDGYGNIKLCDDWGRELVGQYVVVEYRSYEDVDLLLYFEIDGEVKEFEAGFVTSRWGITLTTKRADLTGTYYADDWSTLVLDGFGNATYTDVFGNSITGKVVKITDGLAMLSWTDEEWESHYMIYVYDDETQYFAAYDNSAYVGNFFAPDLRGISFDGSTSVTFLGSNGYYIVENGEVIIYVQDDWDAPYYTINLGKFPAEGENLVYDGVTYYRLEAGIITINGKIVYGDQEQAATLVIDFDPEVSTSDAIFNGDDRWELNTNGDITLRLYNGQYRWEYEEYPIEIHYIPGNAEESYFIFAPITGTTYQDFEKIANWDYDYSGTITIGQPGYGDIILSDEVKITGELNADVYLKGVKLTFEVLASQVESFEDEEGVHYTVTAQGSDGNEYTVSFHVYDYNRYGTIYGVFVVDSITLVQA